MTLQHGSAASMVSAGAGWQMSDRAGLYEPARGTLPPEGAVNPDRSDPTGPPPAETETIADKFLGLFWRTRTLRVLSSRSPVVLMYHSVASGPGDYFGPDVFERHVRLLQSRFHIVGPRECCRTRRRSDEIDVLLTFDDGFMNNALYVAPILKRHQVPVVFFVSTRHCSGNRVLWFAYLSAFSRWFPAQEIALDGTKYDLNPRSRKLSMRRIRDYLLSLRPHPQAMYDKIEHSLPSIESFTPRQRFDDHYAGMAWDHVRELARDPLFEVGLHTVDHPFLTLCDDAEMERQMKVNRVDLERVTGKRIRTIAYPSGDYDARVVAKCMNLGLEQRYTVEIRPSATTPRAGRRRTGDGRRGTKDEGLARDIPRIGIYKPSLSILGLKVRWGNLLRRTPLRFG
jgi:peptidoglycan/xylan/chitin deacetylase (PgdA/CDA1 family)